MAEKDKKDLFETIWSMLASVQLAVAVFIVLALSSIIGTIVEQQAEPAKNLALLAKFFGDSAAPTVYNIFAKLGFMDMYRSWWFVSFLSLFSINLIVCSIDRFPKTWKLVNLPFKPLAEHVIKTLPVKKEIKFRTASSAAVKDEFLNSLKASRYHVLESTEDNATQLYCQKGKYSRLGVYVVHLSIILIFVGAIIGARFGFGGHLNLPEGQFSDVAYTSDGGEIPLGFTVKCNWYETSYYEGLDTPMEFQSELVVIENGREVLTKAIQVNDPLTYKGITFYQSSYGMLPNARGQFIITVTPSGGRPETLRLMFGDSFEIPGTGISGTIDDFSPALGSDRRTGNLTTYSENMVNPAVGVIFNMPGQDAFKGWIFKRYPQTGMLQGGHSIRFDDYWGAEYTGLQVSRDPGVWLIYIACIIMAIGLYVAFFMSHKKIWVHVAHESPGGKGPVRISLGGNTSRNKFAFEKEIDHIFTRASQAVEARQAKK
ncbi:MAG: cytochrome c biogenesis protein ResB [Nitrospirae bacterium]|nr:cytochrome c biogenesis protein ResB [Nitrospirota bacterium]